MDKSGSYKTNTAEEEEEEEEEDDEEEDSSSDSQSDSISSQEINLTHRNQKQRQVSSSSSSTPEEEYSNSEEDIEEQLCPAAQLLQSRQNSSPKVNQFSNNKTRSQQSDALQKKQTASQMSRSVRKTSNKMNSIFIQDRLSEEDEDQQEEENDRPVRANMKIREDTMDGAENPDTDPPQRRKTLEDISITELSTPRDCLPPEYPDDETPPTLLPCLTCNRTFNPTALDRHRKVCQKIAQTSKKKQVFNALTQRFEGLDSTSGGPAGFARAPTPERKTSPPSKKTSRWREKHQEFLRTIRAARGSPEGDADVGSLAPSVPSDYVRCPFCERHFGPKAADRHIEWCKEQSTRLRRNSADTQLMERLKSRTKYVPPKPGQSGWRAPKKTDVISSIPPPSTGPSPGTAVGDRRVSPPPLIPSRRGASPGPPPALSRQYSTASLGRAAAKSFSSLLQAVTGSYSSPYGQRGSVGGTQSGYATPSSYSAYGGSQTPSLVRSGSFSGAPQGGSFTRSASLRVPGSRRSSGARMARRRDLASDMLASVCLGGSPARGEPEGNEGDDFSSREATLSPPPYPKSPLESKFDSTFRNTFDPKYDTSTYDSKFNSKYDTSDYDSKLDSKFDSKYESKLDSALESYDPYSAAEMQMQALLGPSKGTGLGAAGLGIGSLGPFIEENSNNANNLKNQIRKTSPKPRLNKLNISHSLSARRSRQASPSISDILSSSPGTDYNSEKRIWRLSPSPPPLQRDRWSPSPHSPTHAWSPTRSSPNRWSNETPSRNREDRLSITSFSGGSRDGGRYSASSGNTSHREDRRLSSPTRATHGNSHEERFSLSPTSCTTSLRGDRFSFDSSSRDSRFSTSSSSSRADRFSTGSNSSSQREDRFSVSSGNTAIQRTLGNGATQNYSSRKSSVEEPVSSSSATRSSLASLKALRAALQGDGNASRRLFDSAADSQQSKTVRTLSGSSTDSSLPPLSSPTSSASPSKPVRGDAVGGRSDEPLTTPRISITGDFSSTGFSKSGCGDGVEDPLQKAISSLSNIGHGLGSKPEMLVTAVSASSADASKVPKFCYECGHKYPVSVAKFCCNCGSRRATAGN